MQIRVLDRFLLVYKPAERPDKRIIRNVVNGQHIGWAIRVGPWLISTGAYRKESSS